MSGLTSAISQAVSQIQANTTGSVNGAIQGLTGAQANARNAIASGISGAVNNTVKALSSTVIGSVGSLIQGNVSGALSNLTNAPGNIISSALAGLGGQANVALSGAGSLGSMVGIGGANPGNSLGGANARPDPLLSFCWYAQLPVISPGSTQNAASASTTSILNNLSSTLLTGLSSSVGGAVSTSNASSLPWYYVEEAALPFRNYSLKSIFREGRERHYPDRYNVDQLKLAIYADSDNTSTQYLQAWNNAIITPFSSATAATLAGGWGRPSDYKKSIFIYMLDVTKNVLAIIEYIECWPVTIAEYNMDSGTSTRIVNHVSFSVGDVFINLIPVPSTFTQSITSSLSNNAITSVINGFANSGISGAIQSVQSSISSLAPAVGSAINAIF